MTLRTFREIGATLGVEYVDKLENGRVKFNDGEPEDVPYLRRTVGDFVFRVPLGGLKDDDELKTTVVRSMAIRLGLQGQNFGLRLS